MSEFAVLAGSVVLVACVAGLWAYSIALFNAGQVMWGLLSFLAGSVLIFLGVVGVAIADGWWNGERPGP